jgi:GAF domain-containing protein
MTRRATTGGEASKAGTKEKNQPAAHSVARGRGSAAANLQTQIIEKLTAELAQARRDLAESLQQQSATADVLKVISRSTFDLQTVLDTLVDSVSRLCEADMAAINHQKGYAYYVVATYGMRPEYRQAIEARRLEPGRGSTSGRTLVEGRVVHIPDVLADPEYKMVDEARAGGIRTMLGVPLLREGTPIGTITLMRHKVLPFTSRQIELVKTFADQVVIAIENARLFEAEQQRTRELSEALEQQTATSEVLRIISSSPGTLEPVFKTMLENATRICEAKFGTLYLRENDGFRIVGMYGVPPAFIEERKRIPVIYPSPGTVFGEAAATKRAAQIADIRDEAISGVKSGTSGAEMAKLAGARSVVTVPMLKESELVGAILIYRTEVRPFTSKQIALVQNFAAQAVIAIENTRLLNELRESLAQQTATGEVLRIISSSPGELEPVFQAMLESAVRICDAKFGNIYRWDDQSLHLIASHNTPSAFAALRKSAPLRPDPKTPTGRMVTNKSVTHISDLAAEPGYAQRHPQFVAGVELGGIRTLLSVPMLKNDELVGAITIYRDEVRPFADKQIELVQNFAAQAVIAIENARLLNELRESLRQQTATSEVLQVISSSPGELQPVFLAMLENAVRICEAKFGSLFRFDGENFQFAAEVGTPPEYAEKRRGPVQPRPGTLLDRALRTKQVIHTTDYTAEPVPGYAATLGGARSTLCVPMLKDDALVGAVFIYRQEVRPFTDKQIELVQNFAAQAVIAIENTRLLNELRQRTDDLTESLEQQTATSEVLGIVAKSAGDLEPVFKGILGRALRICQANFGAMFRFEGDESYPVAELNSPPALKDWLTHRGKRKAPPGQSLDHVLRTKQPYHIADDLSSENPSPPARLAGARTHLAVPMIREHDLVGVIIIYRQEVRPFTDRQVELVQNFAAQAVIAIENTRLLNELRESLQQQTATADVLKVISRSAFDLQSVLNTLVESAGRLCRANSVGIRLARDGALHQVASFGIPSDYVEHMRAHPVLPDRSSVAGRAALERRSIQITDVKADPEIIVAQGPAVPTRTVLGVPLLRDGTLVGVLVMARVEVESFTEKQIELVATFADQAVIAIENARLLNELRESLQQQTATADVLKVISRSAFDLQAVLDTLLTSAARLCQADHSFIFLREGETYRCVSGSGDIPEWIDYLKQQMIIPGRGTIAARAVLEGRTVHIPDVLADPEYTFHEAQKRGGYRTALGVPLIREGTPIGVMVLTRPNAQPFDDSHIALVTTFADQAVIAVENVRLLSELRQRTDDLSQSLENLQTAQDRLVQTQKLASLGQLTAGIAHEIKNPLNFVNNFSSLSTELLDELREALQSLPIDGKARAEIDELADTLRANLDKIEQHGKRADSIVKNMLLHSREGSGEHRLVDINALVEESLNLAYHGARAEKQGFSITLERSFDPTAGEVDVFPQEITRVLLNMIANGFYAATKRKAEAGDGYEPTLSALTKSLGDRVEIRIRDNGTGIPPEVKDKMFNPFFTTKPPGEGTGLGLSLSHDVIIKQHAGSIDVETVPGEFTEFRIILPRAAATLAKPGGQA